MGEFLALAVSLEHIGKTYGNPQAVILGECLDEATSKFLLNDKSPSRKVGELDNRGSHFYLAMYWAEALANQTKDAGLKASFEPCFAALADNRNTIVAELNAAQGPVMDTHGYYQPDEELVSKAMRPSKTFNQIIEIQSLTDY